MKKSFAWIVMLLVLMAAATVGWWTQPRRFPEPPQVEAKARVGSAEFRITGGKGESRVPEPPRFQTSASQLTGEAAREALRKSGQYESLGAAFQAARYAVEKIDPAAPYSRGAEYFAANSKQLLRAWLSKDGIELASGRARPPSAEKEDAPWSLSMRLRAAGRPGALTPLAPNETRAEGSRVEMKDTSAGVSQWFENRKDGIEQGFVISEKPAGPGALEVLLVVGGTLRAEALPGEGIRFVDAAGVPIATYTKLKAWDATGREIPGRMEPRGAGEVALLLADAQAQYPVTIDPLFASAQARLVEEDQIASAFGYSVALDVDTAVIGASGELPDAGYGAGEVRGHAYVFVRSGTTWREQARLVAGDGAVNDRFGTAVAISGSTIVVGANTGIGRAYVFIRTGTLWTEQAKLTASDGALYNEFGGSVAISGDTVLVGAETSDSATLSNCGFAYVFVRSGSTWSEQAKLTGGADASATDHFGASVALSNSTAVIGAPYDTLSGTNSGTAYVFTRSGTTWTRQARFTGSDTVSFDHFGTAVAVNGNTALVGDKEDTTSAGSNAGSTFVFTRSGTTWSQQAKLTASDGGTSQYFGRAVSISTDTAVIGAFRHSTTAGSFAGAAYVFTRSGTTWTQQTKLTAGDAEAYDYFGTSVAVSGNTALAGVAGDDTGAGGNAGSAHVFTRSGTTWSPQMQLLASDGMANDGVGRVALKGDTAIVGNPNDDTAGPGVGCAYVFVRSGSAWSFQAKLLPADGGNIGAGVALSGDTALIGASQATYVFVRSGTAWTQEAKLTAMAPGAFDAFGGTVAIDGNTAIIGASGRGSPTGTKTGTACIFVRSGTTWNQQAEIYPATTIGGENGDDFGSSVALSGDVALVGAVESEVGTGSAYVFARNGTAWSQQAKLVASDARTAGEFGSSVALNVTTALVGSGHGAYVFVRNATTWTQQAKLTSNDGSTDGFGSPVALSGEIALFGAIYDSTGSSAGSAYAFARSGNNWIQQARLTAGVDASAGGYFGSSVALDSNTALIAALGDDTLGRDAGSIYVFLLGELPAISSQPVSRSVVPRAAITFSVTANGYGPLRYQWRKDGFEIPGADGTSYGIASVTLADAGSYDVVVSNVGGTATSAPATLAVNALSQFTQSFPGTPPGAEGFVLVNLSPGNIGAGWRFMGEQQWRASGVPVGGLTTGDREIEFRPVPGYHQPLRELVGVVSGEPAVVLDRQYFTISGSAGTGGLEVTLKPEALAATTVPVAQRAQWRLLGSGNSNDPNDLTTSPTWRDSGATATGLFQGSYLVECKPVAGRATPAPLSVAVSAGATSLATATYRLADATVGTLPSVLPFETVSTSTGLPYAYVGQVRSDVGSATGFVVKARVVATAAHVVFDDGTLSYVTGLNWSFQRDRGTYEPTPQLPRGIYTFDNYSRLRDPAQTPGVAPGEGTAASQNRDAAALYFLADAGRGGFGGYLASDATDNEWLGSSALKTLVGYPIDNIPAARQGRMHATPPTNVTFSRVPGESAPDQPYRTYTTAQITSNGGNSGGPVCVQFEGGSYYPAAIYLGGSAQTVVRAIDSEVINLFNLAAASSVSGDNGTGGGASGQYADQTQEAASRGFINASMTGAPGAGWQVRGVDATNAYRSSGTTVSITAGSWIIGFKNVAGYVTPADVPVTVVATQLAPTIVGEYVQSFASWSTLYLAGVPAQNAALLADADFDGVKNLLEFAFNLSPTTADAEVLDPLFGESGLPLIEVEGIGASARLTITFLRRKAAVSPGLSYFPEFTSDLSAVTWDPGTPQPPVSLDSVWERVTVEDLQAGSAKRFGRVRVVLTP